MPQSPNHGVSQIAIVYHSRTAWRTERACADTPSHLRRGCRIGGGGTCAVGAVGRTGGEFGCSPIVDRIATTGFDQRGDLHTGGDGLDERSADTGSRDGRKNAFFCSIYGDIIHAQFYRFPPITYRRAVIKICGSCDYCCPNNRYESTKESQQ